MRQPLYAPAIPAAVRAQRALLDATSFNRMAVARALRRDITIAYVDWLKARSSVEIVPPSRALLRENLRVNESLFANGKITEDQVLRAKAELLAVEQQQRETENLASQAQSFFNFLLNRRAAVGHRSRRAAATPTGEQARSSNCGPRRSNAGRKWLASMKLRKAAEEQVRIARKQKWPTLSLGLDAGTQGEDYRFRRRLQLRHGVAGLHLAACSMAAATRRACAKRAPPSARSSCARKRSRSRSGSKFSRRSTA